MHSVSFLGLVFIGDVVRFVGLVFICDVVCFVGLGDNFEEESSFYIAPQNDNEKVSLNEGSIEDFQTIPSIGITLATRIYEYKQLNGEYKQLEDIMNVSGIKETIFNKIKDYIIL